MELLHLRATVGPNLYSIDHPRLVIARVRAHGVEDNCFQRLGQKALQLQEEAIDYRGSFLHVHRLLEEGTANVVFETCTAEVGFAAVRAAVKTVEAVPGDPPTLESIRLAWRAHRLLLSTQAIVDEASRRGIPHLVLNEKSLVQLGYGCNQQRIQDTLTEETSIIAVDLAGDKEATLQLLRSMDIPVPCSRAVRNESDLDEALGELDFPLVLKPVRGHQGAGVATGVVDREGALAAFAEARRISPDVQLEEHIEGDDFRILIIDNEYVAAARREPAQVVGDGRSTIAELVEFANLDPRRGFDHECPLTRLELNESATRCLSRQGFTADSVPSVGQIIRLQMTANLSTGGTATDVTDTVHPENVALFQRVACFIGLDVAGLDVVAPTLEVPLRESGGRLIEVNAAPGFRMHLAPSVGPARNVAAPVVDKLFPEGSESRIPLLAVTGTNGKTTTTRLLAHLLASAGRRVGFTCSDGIYLGGRRERAGDLTDEFATWSLLKDPWVDTAVLEYPRGGIIRAGLGFDACDVGVVLNVAADHLGSRDVGTIEEMAQVKSVVARSVRKGGYAILNADDPHVLAMRETIRAEAALFSLQDDLPVLQQVDFSAVFREGWLVVRHGSWEFPLAAATDLPLTMGGRALFNIQNALAASLAAFVHGLRPEQIRSALKTFDPGVAQTPGRMNYFYGDGFRVLVDYAHNPASMRALRNFLERAEPEVPRTGVLGGTGDRRDEDILELGREAGRMFEKLIIREDADGRGRKKGSAASLVERGARETNPSIVVETCLDPIESVRLAIRQAKAGGLICVLGGDVEASITTVSEFCRPTAY